MKDKIYYLKFLVLVFCLAFASCSDDDDKGQGNPVFPEVQKISCAVGETATLTFNANMNWKLSSSALWCKFVVDGGQGNSCSGEAGEQTITVSIGDDATALNKSYKAEIYLWMGGDKKVVYEITRPSTGYEVSLLDENGNLNEDDRIKQYTLITISKDQNYVNNIKPFDVVAFKMKSTNDNYLTVIHRLINVDYDEHNEPLYTFRGDANPSSMAGEIKVKKNMIVGVFQTNGYQGKKNVPLGYIVGYLRSSIGMIVVITAFFLLIIYTALFDRILEVYNARYNLVLIYRCVAYDIEHAEDSSYVNIDSTYDFSYINVLNQENLKLE